MDDLYVRLQKALDEASRNRFKFVRRLVDRDRRTIERHGRALGADGQPSRWCAGCHYEYVDDCPELAALAEFWLTVPKGRTNGRR